MKRFFKVKRYKTEIYTITIEAESRKDAVEKAEELSNGHYDFDSIEWQYKVKQVEDL
jgi:hypothetical protein